MERLIFSITFHLKFLNFLWKSLPNFQWIPEDLNLSEVWESIALYSLSPPKYNFKFIFFITTTFFHELFIRNHTLLQVYEDLGESLPWVLLCAFHPLILLKPIVLAILALLGCWVDLTWMSHLYQLFCIGLFQKPLCLYSVSSESWAVCETQMYWCTDDVFTLPGDLLELHRRGVFL